MMVRCLVTDNFGNYKSFDVDLSSEKLQALKNGKCSMSVVVTGGVSINTFFSEMKVITGEKEYLLHYDKYENNQITYKQNEEFFKLRNEVEDLKKAVKKLKKINKTITND